MGVSEAVACTVAPSEVLDRGCVGGGEEEEGADRAGDIEADMVTLSGLLAAFSIRGTCSIALVD